MRVSERREDLPAGDRPDIDVAVGVRRREVAAERGKGQRIDALALRIGEVIEAWRLVQHDAPAAVTTSESAADGLNATALVPRLADLISLDKARWGVPCPWVFSPDSGLVHESEACNPRAPAHAARGPHCPAQVISARASRKEGHLPPGGLASCRVPAISSPRLDRALEVQRLLAACGGNGHRRPIPDLIIAATAELHQAAVLHVDSDYDMIAEVTGQAVRRLFDPQRS